MRDQGVCLCILMNHPFPSIIPLLRKIYGQRFKKLLFLVPFERSPDPDVITVYRGSYCHAGYVTDALPRLRQVDCEHFIFMHDDVVLNPRIDDDNFYDVFPVFEQDGFIARTFAMDPAIGSWTWLFGFLPRLLFPKSIVFGAGIERANLFKYLPDPELVQEKLAYAGLPARTGFAVNDPVLAEAVEHASRTLLHGLAEPLDPGSPEQERAEETARGAVRQLSASYMAALDARRATGAPTLETEPGWVMPDLPIVSAGFFADFYILPQVALEDYGHYIGVASAANLFAEMMAPTILHAVCDRVWNAEQFDLDFTHFQPGFTRDLHLFQDDRCVAIHPMKMSRIAQDEAAESRFLEALSRIRDRETNGRPKLAPGRTLPFYEWGQGEAALLDGWHLGESWGRWMSDDAATIEFEVEQPEFVERLTVGLAGPVSARHPSHRGELLLNGVKLGDLEIRVARPRTELTLPVSGALKAGSNRLEIRTDRMVCLAEVSDARDDRKLGLGLMSLRLEPA